MDPIFQPTVAPDQPSFLRRVLDIWSAPQHAVVGAFEAATQGGNIWEGAQSGMASQRSFGEIIRESGVDPTLAGVLGFGADVLTDPTNLIPLGIVGKGLAEGASMVPAIARAAFHEGVPRTIKELLAETPRVGAAAATLAEHRAGAARTAFDAVMKGTKYSGPEDLLSRRAVSEARRAAAIAGTPADDIVTQGNFVARLTNRLGASIAESRWGGLLKNVQLARRQFVSNLKTTLLKDPALGPMGPEIADDLVRSEEIGAKWEGEMTSFFQRNVLPLLRSDAERINFSEIVHGEAVKPLNQSVEEATILWRQASDKAWQDASDIGLRMMVPKTHQLGQGELFPEIAAAAREAALGDSAEWIAVPIQYRQNYGPRFLTRDAIKQVMTPGAVRDNAITKLIANGQADDAEGAARIIDEMVHSTDGYVASPEFRGGPLQFSRELLLDLPYEKDPRKWVPRLSHIQGRRIAQGAVFGPQDEKLKLWLQSVKDSGGSSKRAYDIYRNIIGRPTEELSRYREAASTLGAGQTIMWLGPRTAMLQFMQLANTIGEYGFTNTFRAMGGLLKDPVTRDLASEVGALLPASNMSFEGDIANSWSSWWLKNITQMPRADRVVRTVSGTAGMLAAKKWAQELPGLTGKGAQVAMRSLQRLGIDPAVVLEQGGELSAPQLRSAFLNGANATQFASHLSDMPEMWKTPIGRFMYKFRAFSKQQSTFVSNLVEEAFKRDNPKPLMRYLAAYPAIFQSVRPVLDFLAGRHTPEEEEPVLDHLKAILYTGILGGLGDFFNNATANDTSRILGMLTGPAIGQGAQTLTDIAAATQGNPEPLKRGLIRTIQTPVLRPLNLLNQ